MNIENRLIELERTVRLQKRILVLVGCLALTAATAGFIGPLSPPDPDAFKVTTPNLAGSATDRFKVSGNEDTANVGFLNSQVGIGTAVPELPVHIKRLNANTDVVWNSAYLVAKKSSDMANGFGTGIRFRIEDDAGVENSIGELSCVRDGADNSGALKLSTYTSGTLSEAMRIDSSQRVGIGTTAISSTLDIMGLNSIRIRNVDTDATVKHSKITLRHYTNAEEDLMLLYGISDSTYSEVNIGGGSAAQNATTAIRMYTAANTTTTSGTERLRITSSGQVYMGPYFIQTGDVSIGQNSSNELAFHLYNLSSGTVTQRFYRNGSAKWGLLEHYNFTDSFDFYDYVNSRTFMGFTTHASNRNNLYFNGAPAGFGGGEGVMWLGNRLTAPTSNPSGGGLMYADAGAGKWRGSGGTTTTFGPADPHCPRCKRDFAIEYENPKYGKLSMCMWCLNEGLQKLGVDCVIEKKEAWATGEEQPVEEKPHVPVGQSQNLPKSVAEPLAEPKQNER